MRDGSLPTSGRDLAFRTFCGTQTKSGRTRTRVTFGPSLTPPGLFIVNGGRAGDFLAQPTLPGLCRWRGQNTPIPPPSLTQRRFTIIFPPSLSLPAKLRVGRTRKLAVYVRFFGGVSVSL